LANLEVGAIELHHAPIDVHRLMESMQGSLAALLVNPQVRLEMQVEPDLPELVADADRLRQVAHEPGDDSLRGEPRGRHHRASYATGQSNPVPGSRTSARRRAAPRQQPCISVALSRKLVDLHGGQLQMERREGGLTMFDFGLPINGSVAQVTRLNPLIIRRWHDDASYATVALGARRTT